MSNSVWWFRGLVSAVLVLCIAFSISAGGQGSKGGPLFAIVDLAKVNSDFTKMREAQVTFDGAKNKAAGQLQRRDQMPFLTEDEQKQLDSVYEKVAAQTDADKAKIKEIGDRSLKLSTEYEALRTKPDKDLTDADKAKLREFEATILKAKQQFTTLKDRSDENLIEIQKTGTDKLAAQFKAAVKKVAEQKGVSLVFDGQVAIYAQADLTQPVLDELNKK